MFILMIVFVAILIFTDDTSKIDLALYLNTEPIVKGLDADGNLNLESAYSPACWDTVVRNVKTASNILEVYKDLSYVGYESLEALYEDYIGSALDDYTYVTDVQTIKD